MFTRLLQMLTARTIQIHPLAPAKPPVGAICNGCGVCCADEPCPVGQLLFWRRGGACPALVWQRDELCYRCGLLLEPERHLVRLPRWLVPWVRRVCRRAIAAGSGCDSDAEVREWSEL